MDHVNRREYELVITAENVESTDIRFTMNNLSLGDNYEVVSIYFQKSNGENIYRHRRKGERKISNQTLGRLSMQLFEQSIIDLSSKDKLEFPICQYSPQKDVIRGIYSSVEEFKKNRNSFEYLKYHYDNQIFVIYSWNIFSTIIFAKECLKRFGEKGDKFILVYKDKIDMAEKLLSDGYKHKYSETLVGSRNIIFHGAPGTGKSYLSKELAADIISNGAIKNFEELTANQKKQVEFVQFHPSYDYTDFVEGLRPSKNEDGTMNFELQDGVFKKFIERAQKNFNDANKPKDILKNELNVQESMINYFSNIKFGLDELETTRNNKFYITNIDDKYITIFIPGNKVSNKLKLNISKLKEMFISKLDFKIGKDVTIFFENVTTLQSDSYYLAVFKDIKSKNSKISEPEIKEIELKKYIFIIDEINRGEISKIFGELFFSIDPSYRGRLGEVTFQYANMHDNPDDKLYIPENVYIVGTMNDIDRSVDSFDFAMRRRFRFIEITAVDSLKMLNELESGLEEDAKERMTALNDAISDVETLNANYYIGASYFLKLNNISFDQLWTDYLEPLLQEYIHGMYNENEIMKTFEKAYNYQPKVTGKNDDTEN